MDDLIFVTTGTQFPFDRLLNTVDKWAETAKNVKVVAQVAKTNSNFANMETHTFLSPKEYEKLVSEATLIIGHAGMGTIITGFEQRKPLVLMARKYSLQEHRNDHQQSTTDKFTGVEGVYVADNEQELTDLLGCYKSLKPAVGEKIENRRKLINFISNEIAML
ncbi:glycosyltransferase [Agaribacter flavus]|uniref:Glycosyltransferase n=1 Tax=Agaribacter flavus TaxID=1902781 RepID=A0ABV7FLR9_9ALTE